MLFRYKLRAKVDIADVSDEHVPWVRFGADAEGVQQPGDRQLLQSSTGHTSVLRPGQLDALMMGPLMYASSI